MLNLLKIIVSLPFLFLIGIYKYIISPFTPASCRHYPTCSSYSQEAIQKHGVFNGSIMSVKRIGKCHPWGTQGYDPVPQFQFKKYKTSFKKEHFNLNQSLMKTLSKENED